MPFNFYLILISINEDINYAKIEKSLDYLSFSCSATT